MTAELSRRGTVRSYTDAQYQPPAPHLARTDPHDPVAPPVAGTAPDEPVALAAVELAGGITVLGQVADGYGVRDLKVGAEVELVVEPLDADLSIWRWKPVTELGEESEQ